MTTRLEQIISEKYELLKPVLDERSSICIQLLLYHNNPNNVYLHSFPVTLEFLELSYRNNIKRNQEAHLTFTQKTPTLYQWTTQFIGRKLNTASTPLAIEIAIVST